MKNNTLQENKLEANVRCKDVSKIYRQGDIEVHALRRISIEIQDGSFVSLSGPSGSGKTTLLNLIGGLDRPTSGEIYLSNLRIDTLSSSELAQVRLDNIGFIFQAYNLIPVLSARENVEFVMQLQGVNAAERKERAYEILNAVGLNGLENRRPGELSGGQQQRVAVARAIVSNPEIVLADEPTANLDSKTAKNLLEIMLSMCKERKVTFIFSTHDKLVMEYAERLIKLHDGEIVSDE
ncbi:MAG: ABC transporter ATP-binding protein [Deltaproteobacteria bacterium]|nr:ABC transporter ATP-binding protein [Deltaproteobacteria bacterium]